MADRDEAGRHIEAGRVLVSGSVATKAERQVSTGEPIVLSDPPARYVSRGGDKLAAALHGFGVDPAGRRVLDAGASTGGFTDCVLQAGAASVVAVDVGYGQLHERVGRDPRVRTLDRTNIRHLAAADLDELGGPMDLVVADLSFISLRTVIEALLRCCAAGADIVALVKPQFEAERVEASRGRGVITDPAVWRRVLEEVIAATSRHGGTIMGAMVSPLTGSDGNVEFLVHVRAPGGPPAAAPVIDLDAVVASVPVAPGETSR